jgi:hypothetical protein
MNVNIRLFTAALQIPAVLLLTHTQQHAQFLRNIANVIGGSIRLVGATARDVFGSSTVQGGRKGSFCDSPFVWFA